MLQYVAGVTGNDGAAIAVHNVAVGNAAGGGMAGNLGALIIVAHDGEELNSEIVDKALRGVRGAVLAEENDIHLAGFLDILVGFDNIRHLLAAGAAPAGGIQEDEIVGLIINTALHLLDLLQGGDDGAGLFLCLLLILLYRGFGGCFGVILSHYGQLAACQCGKKSGGEYKGAFKHIIICG